MNVLTTNQVKRTGKVTALFFSSILIISCASTPESPQGAEQARAKLTALQNDPNLADRARVELREAEVAVRTAEKPLSREDAALGKHRVYMADRKIAIAEAKASTRYAEYQRSQLGEERDAARLQARTREVGRARDETERARDEASSARDAAITARTAEAESSALAARQAADYQRQIDALEAKITDRGVVLTLGDVLFATGSAELQGGANRNLDKLVSFLNQYPERQVLIEGHTDNVGSVEYNQALSRRRADSVRHYLSQNGIASQRISTSGIGMDRPVATNESATGRQQNRRVEIIIENPS